jgi:hypothetical protein
MRWTALGPLNRPGRRVILIRIIHNLKTAESSLRARLALLAKALICPPLVHLLRHRLFIDLEYAESIH